jgi:hypothetical protein
MSIAFLTIWSVHLDLVDTEAPKLDMVSKITMYCNGWLVWTVKVNMIVVLLDFGS